MNPEELSSIRQYLVENIFRNPTIMFNEHIRGVTDSDPDLCEIIASLYEVLHRQIMQEPYEYMFHWANKCGSDVDDQLFIKGANE